MVKKRQVSLLQSTSSLGWYTWRLLVGSLRMAWPEPVKPTVDTSAHPFPRHPQTRGGRAPAKLTSPPRPLRRPKHALLLRRLPPLPLGRKLLPLILPRFQLLLRLNLLKLRPPQLIILVP